MLKSSLPKVLIATIALSVIMFAAIAAVVVNKSAREADRDFEAVILLSQIDEYLLRTLTSSFALVQQEGENPELLVRSLATDLAVLKKLWRDFSDANATGHAGMSDLFAPPLNIDDEANAFFSLASSLELSSLPNADVDIYNKLLHQGRNKMQEGISLAAKTAQEHYAAARLKMQSQLQISLLAIVILLLVGLWLVDRMLVASAAATAAAESAARSKENFLATMSHEIRTPMSGVLGMAELLERTELTEKQKLYVSTILASGEALTAIINDVLDLAKINAGKMTVRTHPFDLVTLAEDVAMLLSPRAAGKNTELTVRVQPDLPSNFIGDAGHIRQTIVNLVGNAVKFTENGTVLLDISGDVQNGKASLTISVEDTGLGIPADQIPHLFKTFEQVEDTDPTRLANMKKQKGTGLGLAISKKLVKLMGGTIGVTSEVGKGSRFWFTVDLSIDPDAVSEDAMPQDIAGARILVVDDNPINRTVTVEQLQSRALEANAVADAAAALRTLRESAGTSNAYDLAVLDYHMPGMDGLELAAEIRNDGKIGKTPLLMLTSIMNAGDDDDFRNTKIDGHLSKPVRVSLMFETIVDVLRRSKFRSPPTPAAHDESAGSEASQASPSPNATETHARRLGPSSDTQQYPRRHDPRSFQKGTGRR